MYIYPVTMVSVGYHCGLSVIYHGLMALAKGLDFTTATGNILVDTTLKCGISNTYA